MEGSFPLKKFKGHFKAKKKKKTVSGFLDTHKYVSYTPRPRTQVNMFKEKRQICQITQKLRTQ